MESSILILFASSLIALAGWSVALVAAVKSHLHILQLEDYNPLRMLRLQLRHPKRLELWGLELWAIPPLILTLGWEFAETIFPSIIGGAARTVEAKYPDLISNIFLWSGIFIWGWGCYRRGKRKLNALPNAKKPLVMTTRAKRLFWTNIILSYAAFFTLSSVIALGFLYVLSTVTFLVGVLVYGNLTDLILNAVLSVPLWPLIAMYLIERGTPLFLAATAGVLWLPETIVQNRYLREARAVIKAQRPLVIGITGSYGKTSTKEILSALLVNKFNLLRPPGSYNTLMGVTRLIREQLRPNHEAFVVEMGAYRRGSIARLCDLVQPSHGIITTIGVQHLERFHSQREIQRAKAELVEALPPDGVAILNGDDPLCCEMTDRHSGEVIFFSVDNPVVGSSDPTVQAPAVQRPRLTTQKTLTVTNVYISLSGSDFDIIYPDGESQAVHLSLLGRSAIANTAAAVAMADRLGVPRADIARTLATLSHIRHRLEPTHHENGVTVIDDAYNSNPIGARNALELLSLATGGRRVLVTPGMIELGVMEEEANYEFGRQAAEACDLAVLIGVKRVQPIRDGLLSAGFPEPDIWVYPTLTEALEKLQTYLKPGDTMLLENDLPDQYAGL